MTSKIKVDTIEEKTSANGVSIDSLAIKDGKITNLMNATLSAADLGAGVHIKTGDSGGGVTSTADELVVEGSGDMGIQLMGGASSSCGIAFGDSGDSNVGLVSYNHANDSMIFKTNDTVHQTISADGEVLKPLQPCFRIGSGTQNNIPVSVNQDAVFSVEVFDIGNNFGSSVFTAPVTGKYYLNAMFRFNNVDSASSFFQVSILGSNRNTTIFTYHNPSDLNSDADNVSFSGAAILDMDANDTASVRIRIQGGTAQTDVDSDGSYFSGYLIG